MGRDFRFGQVEPEVEIVNEQEVDPIHAEPHLRLFIGPHDAVVTVVVHVIETEAARPWFRLELRRGLAGGKNQRPTLVERTNSDRGFVSRKRPRTNLRQTPTVIGGSVVITNTGVPRRFQRGGRRRFVDPDEELA